MYGMSKWLSLVIAVMATLVFSIQMAVAQIGYIDQGVVLVPVNLRTSEKLLPIVACTGPIHSVAIVPNGEKAYVTAKGLHDGKWQVCSLDLKTKTIKQFPLLLIDHGNTELLFPPGVRISPRGDLAFVLDIQGNRVIPIDVVTDQVKDSIDDFLWPYDIAFAPNGETAYVTNLGGGTGAGFVLPVDLTTMALGERIQLSNSVNAPALIVITPDGKLAFVTRSDSKGVTVIDLKNNMEERTIKLDNVPDKMVIAPDGQSVYLSGWQKDVGPILMRIGVNERAQDEPISLANLGKGPVTALGISPDGGFLYIGLENDDQTFILTPLETTNYMPSENLASFGTNYSNIAIVPDVFPTNKVFFIGDSVTAGFGYCGSEEPGSILSSCGVNEAFSDSWRPIGFTLATCRPPELVNNQCSNNNKNGEPWLAGDWEDGKSSPTVAYSFVIARKQAPNDEALIQNWAMTGSEPRDWDPIGVQSDVRGGQEGQFSHQVRTIRDSYVVMTLGANPLLDDYLKIKVIKDGQCAAKTVIGSGLSAQHLNFEADGLGACFMDRWNELKQGEHLENLYRQLLEQGNHVLVVGYPVVCPWSFGNWQPYANILTPSGGKPCDSDLVKDKKNNITQMNQASWLAEQANNMIQSIVTKTRTDLNTENIQFAQPNTSMWLQHQAWMEPTWVFKNDTWVHPNTLGHRELANTVITATCHFFGHWCYEGQDAPLHWSASENQCFRNRAVRDDGRCEEPLRVNPCLGDGWQSTMGSDGSTFANESACTTYVGAGGSLVSQAMLVLEDVRLPPVGNWGRLTGSGLMPGADMYQCIASAGSFLPGCDNIGVRTDASGNLLLEQIGGCQQGYFLSGVYYYTTRLDGTTITSNVVDQTTCSNPF